jgi:hypothetical protein
MAQHVVIRREPYVAAAVRFGSEIDQRDLELAEPPRFEEVYDFSVIDEVLARR